MDILRVLIFRLGKAESELRMVGTASEVFASALCTETASVARTATSRALPSEAASGISDVAGQTRRLLGPQGGVAQQDAPGATDVDMNSNDGDDFAAWVVRRWAENEGAKKKTGDG